MFLLWKWMFISLLLAINRKDVYLSYITFSYIFMGFNRW
uniref:Uncharacterized protein n=1 Tax=Rhizophora mucronata TaxID=61149 RepID=A0A2P2N7X4_RHIMU